MSAIVPPISFWDAIFWSSRRSFAEAWSAVDEVLVPGFNLTVRELQLGKGLQLLLDGRVVDRLRMKLLVDILVETNLPDFGYVVRPRAEAKAVEDMNDTIVVLGALLVLALGGECG